MPAICQGVLRSRFTLGLSNVSFECVEFLEVKEFYKVMMDLTCGPVIPQPCH